MATRGPLPFMKSIADAEALVEKERDPFYLDAFMIEGWLGHIILEAAAEYAEKKHAKERVMQNGQAWRGFLALFGHAQDNEFHHIYQSLLRFSQYDDCQSEMLIRTIVPLSFEHECFGDYVGPKTMTSKLVRAEVVALLKRSVERWCEWIDSCIHFQTHASWHLMPEQFDQDVEKRELAALGVNQRLLGGMSEFGKAWWEWHHGEAAVRYKDSPKWRTVGKAMAAEGERHWNYPDLDNAVISIWPLVKKHNWTYRDLMEFLTCQKLHSKAYPCEREQDLAAYCSNVLGLRKSGQGKSAADGRPAGYEVAVRLFEMARQSGPS